MRAVLAALAVLAVIVYLAAHAQVTVTPVQPGLCASQGGDIPGC